MKTRTLNLVLLVLLAVAAGMTWGLQRDATEPNVVFLPEMYYSVPYDPQSANPNFADGTTLRSTVEGTIPRGLMPLHYAAGEADARRAGEELINPFHRDSLIDTERGVRMFATFCQPCHGPLGHGDGIVTRHGFPPPPSFRAPNALAMKDGQLFHAITYGKGNMPALASQISREDRWRIILRVRALQEAAANELPGAPK